MTQHNSKSGITRQLARVIFLQLIFISLITVLGVIVAAKVVEGVMMRAALEGEAEHFWKHYTEARGHPLPNTDNLRGYLMQGNDHSAVPEALRGLPVGYGRSDIDGRQLLVFVDQLSVDGEETRLYLVFDEQSVAKLSFYFGVVPLSLVLIVIYLSAWFGFRQSRKAVSPLVALAARLRQVQPKQNRLVDLDLSNLKTSNVDDEINVLVDSLSSFTGEINQLIERERRFTRDASHELRTPLTVIQGSAEYLLATTKLEPKQRSTLVRINRTVHDMNELVNALLILARGNNAMLQFEDVSINQTITRQLDQLQLTHNQENHVKVSTDHRQQVNVSATPQFVDAVTGNLLRNAFNYTRQGEVFVVIDDRMLEVRNKGEGVIPPAGDNIFDPFVRGSNEGKQGGYGVGLDIVKRLCELFGWTVESDYNATNGMVFRIRF